MTSPTSSEVRPQGLLERIIGVIVSPRATFANVVAVPRPAGVLFIVALVIGISTAIPQATERGQQAIRDFQAQQARDNPAAAANAPNVERILPYYPYITLVGSLIFLPVMTLFMTAVYWAIFNVVLGGTATYKQALAVVTHSSVVAAIGALAALPIMLSNPSMSFGGPFNLGALAAGLEPGSTLARMLRNLSVFHFWGAYVTAVGLAVLYRRKLGGILATVLAVTIGLVYLGSLFGPR
jgi:hypothetical protein